jgi:hypothetical protein
MALRTATTCCVVVGAGRSSSVICRYVLKTRRVGTSPSGPAVSFTALTAICKTISFVVSDLRNLCAMIR